MIAATCNSYKLELLDGGVHRAHDDYRLALYSANANLSDETTHYTTKGEIRSEGYDAGGQTLTGREVALQGRRATLTWTGELVWDPSTIAAPWALIYNHSREDRAVAVLDLRDRNGNTARSSNGPFKVTLPSPTVVLGGGVSE